jgi:hypothetical protein
MIDRPQKITLAEMRDVGVRRLLIYCSDCKCSHLITMGGDRWPDHVRLSDLEARLICSACGKRGGRRAAGFQLEWTARSMKLLLVGDTASST